MSAPATTTWAAVDLAPVLAGVATQPEPTTLGRTDGVQLLYAGKIHQVSGEPECGKGWLACRACAELIDKGQRVVYIDFEDSEESIVARLRALGCGDDEILASLTYLRPNEPLTGPQARADLEVALAPGPALVVIDGVTEALTIHGLDLGDNRDIAKWFEILPRPAARTGAPVVQIDHVVKDKEARGRYAIGGQHKLAGVDVAYALEVVQAFGRGRDGLVKVTVAKDRPGAIRQHANRQGLVAEMRLRSDASTGSVEIDLEPPEDLEGEGFRPTVLMGRLWGAIESDPGITLNRLREAVKGNNNAKAVGLQLLIDEDYVHVEQDGQARRHHVAKPFLEEAPEPNRAHRAQPRFNRAQARSKPTAPTAPPP